MEVMQVLHMNTGAGETSYATNSVLQSNIISTAKPIMKEAVLDIFKHVLPESVGIADLGCSSGPNTLAVVSEVLNVIHEKWEDLGRPLSPEFRVYLNDLNGNDFNNVFGLLPAFYKRLKEEKGSDFGPCFISGVPSSFYGRVFPTKSLHFVHSSSSLHWLSQVPRGLEQEDGKGNWNNKGKIYISKTSPDCVVEAYSLQFQEDWSVFLKSRAEEIVGGGRMVLSFIGRRSTDPRSNEACYQWELLARALMAMASEGLIDEEKVDSFNAPYYAPCPEEVKLGIYKEGSFNLDGFEMFEIDWDGGDGDDHEGDIYDFAMLSGGERVAKTIRAVVESMLESRFGGEVMDDLFLRYARLVGDHLASTRAKYINFVISLVRK